MFQFSSSKKIFLKFSKRKKNNNNKNLIKQQPPYPLHTNSSSWNDFLQIFQHSDFSTWFDPRFRVRHRAYVNFIEGCVLRKPSKLASGLRFYPIIPSSRCGGVRAEEFHRGVKKKKREREKRRRRGGERGRWMRRKIRRNSIVSKEKKKTKRRLLKKKRNDSGAR